MTEHYKMDGWVGISYRHKGVLVEKNVPISVCRKTQIFLDTELPMLAFQQLIIGTAFAEEVNER